MFFLFLSIFDKNNIVEKRQMSLWWFNTFFAALKSLKELAYISRALSVLDFMCAQGREEDRGMHATDVGQPTESN